MNGLIRLLDGANSAARWLCILSSGAIFLLAMAQILFRYVFMVSAPWTEEAARYLMIWMALLAAGLAFLKGDHFNIDFITTRLNPGARRFFAIGMDLLAGIFVLCIIAWGIPFAQLGFFTTAPGLQISMFIPYLALPVGGVLMLANLARHTIRLLSGGNEEEAREAK
jgi:TRAP-type C4-dicarboxylate transport system permease small subunit